MRDAKRALGERSPHRARLKGATSRGVRPLAARRSRGAVALFKRVFSEAQPQAASPHGVIFVPHFMREHGGRRHSCLRSRGGRVSGDEHPPRGVPAIAHLQRALFLSVHVGLKPYAKQFRPVGALIFRLPAGTLRGRKPNPSKSRNPCSCLCVCRGQARRLPSCSRAASSADAGENLRKENFNSVLRRSAARARIQSLKSPKSLFVFARPTTKTRTSSPPKAAQKTLPRVFPRERLSLSSKP